ncbi:MAG: LCP family protein [Acidimicrobiales bacterium]
MSEPSGAPRHRWTHRVLKGLIVLVGVAVLGAGGTLVYVRQQLSEITRVEIPQLTTETDAGPIRNVLLVGSDSRDRLSGEAAAQAGKGEVTGKRSDTLMVLHIDPRQARAMIVSIPRDLFVEIPGIGRRDRVNSAFSRDGAPGLVATIEESLGIPINHYVEVDFVGFSDIVDSVGGVNVFVPAPARDRFSGLNLSTAGCIPLDGTQGLAWVRSRHYESYESGRWRTDPTGDIGRIQRQQDFVRRMMRRAVEAGISNPITLNRLVGIGVRDVTLDAGMSTGDILSIARRFRSLDPGTVEMLTLPTSGATIGGASVLLLKEAEAQPIIDRLNGLGPPPSEQAADLNPADIHVLVQNGTGGDGVASRAAGDLGDAGFAVDGVGDANRFGFDTTVIRHRPGQGAQAQALAGRLAAGGARLEEGSVPGDTDLILIIGADFKGVRQAAAAQEPVTAPGTTVAPTGPESAC